MRKGGFWVLLLVAGGLYIQNVAQRDQHVYAGIPKLISYANPSDWVHVIANPGFLLGYSELRRNPLWVAYKLEPVKKKQYLPRPGSFTTDWRTLIRVSHEDYSRSGYDRGHLAPNYAMSQLYGRPAQYASFRMTNIVPQRPHLNRELWQRLEEVEIDHLARRFGELWVVAGPVFDAQSSYLKSGVEIPDGFYKVYLDVDSKGAPHVLGFLVPQDVKGTEPLSRFLVTIDEIEKQTGFDFNSGLPDAIEQRIESQAASARWRLSEVESLAPRYRVKP